MKILTAALLFALCGVSYAGSGKEMKQMVAPAADCPKWTGFYIGAFTGYSYDDTDVRLGLGGDWSDYTGKYSKSKLNSSGMQLGGLIGYNYEFDNHWVVGMEATGSYLWLGRTGVPSYITTDSYAVSTSLTTHYLVTVGPRIGYAFCKWMPYVTGGLALGDIDFHQAVYDGPGDTVDHEAAYKSSVKVGWFVGAGVQYAITNHWSARLQYQFVDLGSVSGYSRWVPPYPGYIGVHSASLLEHNVSAAIIYEF